MRTTINVRDDLLRRAKRAAAEQDMTLNAVVERALNEFLARKEEPQRLTPIDLPRSNRIGGTQPGVDLNDTAALLDVLEGRA